MPEEIGVAALGELFGGGAAAVGGTELAGLGASTVGMGLGTGGAGLGAGEFLGAAGLAGVTGETAMAGWGADLAGDFGSGAGAGFGADWASGLSALGAEEVGAGFGGGLNPSAGGFGLGDFNMKDALKYAGPVLNGYSGIEGIRLAQQLRKQGAGANPWMSGGGQGLAQQQLMDVLNGGSTAYQNTPAFKARMQAAMRGSAAQGGVGSGNMAVAAANAGGAGYNEYIQQMAGLAGAPGNPGLGLQYGMGAAGLESQGLASLGYGVTQATGGNTMMPQSVKDWFKAQVK